MVPLTVPEEGLAMSRRALLAAWGCLFPLQPRSLSGDAAAGGEVNLNGFFVSAFSCGAAIPRILDGSEASSPPPQGSPWSPSLALPPSPASQ